VNDSDAEQVALSPDCNSAFGAALSADDEEQMTDGRLRLGTPMRAVLLDRDGVVNVNRKYNVKTPPELCLIEGAAEAISRLNRAGVGVGLCTNQPEVQKGIINRHQLDEIHRVLRTLLARRDAKLDLILCCMDDYRSAWHKPAPGMLFKALRHFGVRAADTFFVGDQLSDLQAAAHARCHPVLVRTGLGRKTEAHGLPNNIGHVSIHDDLAGFVDAYLHR
jgi:D-glycero-D-manno-heptose 1,7-bisphosphate phosphatase